MSLKSSKKTVRVAAAVIRDGNVWVEDSICPDHLCEKTGSIRKEGQVILCLPEKVALRIIPEEVDAVVG